MKTMMITGGSSGIGKATAELFAAKGYKVYELSRHGESREGISHIDSDVTKPADCAAAVKQVMEKEGRLDVLISNAGMGISGAVEYTAEADWKRQMDVNFNGAVNITQAALPSLRLTATQQHALRPRIIFVSSMMANFAIPFQAFYTASKFAINGFALALKNEMRPFGVEVCCLMPGDVKTGFTDARKDNVAGKEVYTHMQAAVAQMAKDEQNGQSPMQLARKLLSLAEAGSPEPLSTVGLMYKAFMLLGRLLPTRLAYWIISKMY